MNHPAQQVQTLLFLDCFYIMALLHLKPYESAVAMRMELINELIFGIIVYHMMTFTGFVLQQETKFELGYSFIAA
jgi:hypothetical protein